MLSKLKTKNNSYLSKITVVSLVLMSAVIFLLPNVSHAQILVPQVNNLSTGSIEEIAGTVIQLVLGLLGLIALVIVLYAGFMWMTSAGNEEKITQAKKILSAGVIGLVIILTSYIITSFILKTIQEGAGGGGGGYEDYTEGLGGFGGGALGGGVIEYHYPARDATNIPRNTLIMISFKVQVATSSVISGSFSDNPGQGICANYTNDNTNGNACGKLSDDIEIADYGAENIPLNSDDVIAVLTADGKNILLRPIYNLGNEENSSDTIIHLGAGMITADDKNLFGGLENGYAWQFEVSTFLDLTPPTVSFVWPEGNNGGDKFARNAIIQMTFSEPINILSVNQDTVTSTSSIGGPLTGKLRISNQYRTVEFLSNMDCGTGVIINSCGEEVFCLPGDSIITSTSTAGDLLDFTSGINDAAGNFLDGNGNGEEEGFPNDDYSWAFETNDDIDTTAPEIDAINPNNNDENIQLNPYPRISASSTEVLSPGSLTTESFYIYDYTICNTEEYEDYEDEEGKSRIPNICFPQGGYSVYISNNSQKCNLQLYSPYLENNTIYRPRLTSEIKDSYGNCFNPAQGPGGTGQQ